jgi:hypothetical protein
MTRAALMARWAELGDKLSELAEVFPDAQYDFRPTAEVRSVAEHLRHVAFWNEYVGKTLRREGADGEANELPAGQFRTKAAIVHALKESIATVARELSSTTAPLTDADEDTLIAFIEHGGEHYGQLVVYARLNGIVPPASRGT